MTAHRHKAGTFICLLLGVLATVTCGTAAPRTAAPQIKPPRDSGLPVVPKQHPSELQPFGNPSISALSYVLMDVRTGAVLLSRGPNTPRYPASLTKIMTGWLAAEDPHLDRIVTISARAAAVKESSLWLEPGERISLCDLLYGMLLHSANDAATAIAEAEAGSVEAFVARMNARAQEIGCTHTHFVNPHGLHDPEHYTTALDLARITRHALQNPVFREIVRTKVKQIPWGKNPWNRVCRNKNRLLWQWDEADGVKTGYTHEAGRCLVGSATRDGWQLLAVVLYCNRCTDDAHTLIEYGFDHYQQRILVPRGATVGKFTVSGGDRSQGEAVAKEDFTVVVPRGTNPQVSRTVKLRTVKAPVGRGEVVGDLTAHDGLGHASRVDLVAARSVDRASWRTDTALPLGVLTILALVLVRFGRRTSAESARRRRDRFTPGG